MGVDSARRMRTCVSLNQGAKLISCMAVGGICVRRASPDEVAGEPDGGSHDQGGTRASDSMALLVVRSRGYLGILRTSTIGWSASTVGQNGSRTR